MKFSYYVFLIGFFISNYLLHLTSAIQLESACSEKENFVKEFGSNETSCTRFVDLLFAFGLTRSNLFYLEPVTDLEYNVERRSDIDVSCTCQDAKEYIVQMNIVPKGEKLHDIFSLIQYYAVNAYIKRMKSLSKVYYVAIVNDILFPGKPEFLSADFVIDKGYSYYNNTAIDENDLKKFSLMIIETPKLSRTYKPENLKSGPEKLLYINWNCKRLSLKERLEIFKGFCVDSLASELEPQLHINWDHRRKLLHHVFRDIYLSGFACGQNIDNDEFLSSEFKNMIANIAPDFKKIRHAW